MSWLAVGGHDLPLPAPAPFLFTSFAARPTLLFFSSAGLFLTGRLGSVGARSFMGLGDVARMLVLPWLLLLGCNHSPTEVRSCVTRMTRPRLRTTRLARALGNAVLMWWVLMVPAVRGDGHSLPPSPPTPPRPPSRPPSPPDPPSPPPPSLPPSSPPSLPPHASTVDALVDTWSPTADARIPLMRISPGADFDYDLRNHELHCTGGSKQLVGISGPPARLKISASTFSVAGSVAGNCRLRLDNVNILTSGTDDRELVSVLDGGALFLSSRSVVSDGVNVAGPLARVYYALPAPLGMYVGGGTMQECGKMEATLQSWCETTATKVVEFTESSSSLDAHLDALPRSCFAGFVGDSDVDARHQRTGVCYRPCPIGSYCPAGAADPTPCSPGTFNPAEQGASPSVCIPCPRGSRCVGGTGDHELCPVNFYQREFGQGSCRECDTGMSCPKGAVEPVGVPCARGQYCPEGLSCLGNGTTFCVDCPVGHSCDGQDKRRCPEGTHSTQLGEHVCTPCPAGSYMNDVVYRLPPPSPPPPLPPPSPSPPPPISPPAPPGASCLNMCLLRDSAGYGDGEGGVASDGVCDDGGAGSTYSLCALGTDCADCGFRMMPPPPPPPPPPPHFHIPPHSHSPSGYGFDKDGCNSDGCLRRRLSEHDNRAAPPDHAILTASRPQSPLIGLAPRHRRSLGTALEQCIAGCGDCDALCHAHHPHTHQPHTHHPHTHTPHTHTPHTHTPPPPPPHSHSPHGHSPSGSGCMCKGDACDCCFGGYGGDDCCMVCFQRRRRQLHATHTLPSPRPVAQDSSPALAYANRSPPPASTPSAVWPPQLLTADTVETGTALDELISGSYGFRALSPVLRRLDVGLSAKFDAHGVARETDRYYAFVHQVGRARPPPEERMGLLRQSMQVLNAPPLAMEWLKILEANFTHEASPAIMFGAGPTVAKLYVQADRVGASGLPNLPLSYNELAFRRLPSTRTPQRGDILSLEWNLSVLQQEEVSTRVVLRHYEAAPGLTKVEQVHKWARQREGGLAERVLSAIGEPVIAGAHTVWRSRPYRPAEELVPPMQPTKLGIFLGAISGVEATGLLIDDARQLKSWVDKAQAALTASMPDLELHDRV